LGRPYLEIEITGENGYVRKENAELALVKDNRELVFNWTHSISGVEGLAATLGSRILFASSTGGIVDNVGNPHMASESDQTQLAFSLEHQPASPPGGPASLADVGEKEGSGFFSQGDIVYSVGIGMNNALLNGKDKRTSGGYTILSNMQPLGEAAFGYNFLPAPARLSVNATASAQTIRLDEEVTLSNETKVVLDRQDVPERDTFFGLELAWKPAPTGFGGVLQGKQRPLLVLHRESSQLAVYELHKVTSYGLGVDYHFNLWSQRFGLYALVESYEETKGLKNVDGGVETGIDWSGTKQENQHWYSARLYYHINAFSTEFFDYYQSHAGLKFSLNY